MTSTTGEAATPAATEPSDDPAIALSTNAPEKPAAVPHQPSAAATDPATHIGAPVPAVVPVSVRAPDLQASSNRPGLWGRAMADGLTGPAVVALATALVSLGVVVDLQTEASVSLGTFVTLLVAAVAAPAIVRFRSLATAAVLPPLLMAGAAAAIGRLSGQDHGSRELVLDVGTTLALWAPALFGAAVASVLVVLVRVGHRLIR